MRQPCFPLPPFQNHPSATLLSVQSEQTKALRPSRDSKALQTILTAASSPTVELGYKFLPSSTMSQEDASAREASRYEQKHLVAPKTPGFEVRTESINLLDEDDGKSLAFKPTRQRISLINLAVNWVLRSRITIRVLAVMASLVSFVLITYSVVLFENAQKAGNVKDSTGANPQVNVKPAVTFSGIGGASFFLSLLLLFACCGSKKVRC